MQSDSKRKLKIAIMGTRGIPASYGGFETFAEELSVRLVGLGHDVTVFGRRFPFAVQEFLGQYRSVNIKYSLTLPHKYLETIIATFTSFLHLFWQRYDVILLCNAANSPFAWIPRLLNVPIVINVDGIERLRSKWNWIGRMWYRIGEKCSVLFASKIVADAEVIKSYYYNTHNSDSTVIAYGATVIKRPAGSVLEKFRLKAQSYILYVSRLEPENNALGVIQAFTETNSNYPLVIVGDAPYADNYKNMLHQAADSRVIFTGYQFNENYQELRSNCLFYIQATEVGGTHPALVEAMAYGNCVVANGTPENHEVLGEAGLYYEKNNFSQLRDIINMLINDHETLTKLGLSAEQRANKLYTWDRVTRQYEELLQSVVTS